MRYFFGAAHEQFTPGRLLEQAVEAEDAGFEGIACSDHLQPWWRGGEAGHAWVWLGALGQATRWVPIGTAVTPPGPRYHPVMIAQAWATLESMFPGRPYLGFGSGESLNESPLGAEWPDAESQVDRMREALEIINALFEGETVSYEGAYFKADRALLHTLPRRRPPIYVSAFAPKAAAVAAEFGDGLWTPAHPEQAPGVIDAYLGACEDSGRASGEIILQAQFSWAEDDNAALEGARVWKGAQPEEFYTEDWHDPAAMYERGEELVSDEQLKQAVIISSDPEVHADSVREAEGLGASTMVLMNVSGAEPIEAIRVYGERVLPSLRSVRA